MGDFKKQVWENGHGTLSVCNGANNGVLCTCIMNSASIKTYIVFFAGLMVNTSVTVAVYKWIKNFMFAIF